MKFWSSILFSTLIIFKLASVSGQDPTPKPLEVSLVAKTDFFKWREYSDDKQNLLVEDFGNLWGGGARATYDLNQRWRLYADGNYFAGNIRYNGYIISQGNAQPYTQQNGYKGWDANAKACYKFNISSKIRLQPNLGLSARQWTRDLVTYSQFTSLLTYNERYFMLSPQAGLDGVYQFNSNWSLMVSLALSYPVISHEQLLFNDPDGLTAAFQQGAATNPNLQAAADYDWTDVSVDNGKNFNPMIEGQLRFKGISCFIRYQQYTLGRSTDGGTQGVSIHQPHSKNDILSIGLIYAILH